MREEGQPLVRRTPGERVAYVAGYAAGWKAAIAPFSKADQEEREQELNARLDLLSDIENSLRAEETAGA